MSEVHVEAVRVIGRFRKDLGDIESLAKSIADIGLMQPIVVTPEMRLIAGHRRLAACRSLGWDSVPALIVDNLGDAALRLRAERDENTERKAMTYTELVALGKALEALERPKAAARKAAGQVDGGRMRHGSASVSRDTEAEPLRTKDVVGKALGMSPMSYYRARTVVEAGTDPQAEPEVKAILSEMEETGNVAGAYDKLRGHREPTVGAPRATTITGVGPQRRVISKADTALSGICHALDQITEIHPHITSEEAAQWVGGLSESRAIIERLIKRLKERTNAQA